MNPILQSDHERWMNEALKEAKRAFVKGEVPVGAVVVLDNKIIGRGYNQVEMLQDPTAHAEMIAITAATNSMGSKWLTNADLYVTVEPCSMCAGALVLARVRRVFYGVAEEKTGAHSSLYNVLNDPRANHRIEVHPGILRDQCQGLMVSFFEEMRRRN
jgi:tRNA(adenine34) deaminase